MSAKNRKKGSKSANGVAVQTRPNFTIGMSNPISATAYLLKAEKAFAANEWRQACTLAQTCITNSLYEPNVRYVAQNLYASALLELREYEQAYTLWRALEKSLPNNIGVLLNIGLVLIRLTRYDESITYLNRVVAVAPDNVTAYVNLGLAYSDNGDIQKAKASFLQVLKLDPSYTVVKFNLGIILQSEGLLDEAKQIYEDILKREPNHVVALSNLININHLNHPTDIDQHMSIIQRFGKALEGSIARIDSVNQRELQPHSPLRIGFISGDLRHHVVSYFLESVLTQLALDSTLRSKVQLFAYYTHHQQDEYTQRLKAFFDLWRQVEDLNDTRLSEQINTDQIDILIDLSGHTVHNRLSVFAAKPAPIQVGWLGYWGSTGLSRIDYVLADPICVPDGEEKWFVEKIWRLPHLRYCFAIPNDAPPVSPPPCIKNPPIVFGCYQSLAKINQGVLLCWEKILCASPNARLRVQSNSFQHAELKDKFIERINLAGLNIQQIDLVCGMDRQAYLASYADVDILLDTFPYPGGTTTAEALWMGTPTITLSTTGMLGRQGEALLVNAGLPDWVAHSEEEYVQKAITWANADLTQRQQLADLRIKMREQVKRSPVFNAQELAVGFVDAMYAMWQEKIGNL